MLFHDGIWHKMILDIADHNFLFAELVAKAIIK